VVVDLERSDGLDAGLDEVERTLGYPAFVKPVKAGSSVGIGKARDRAALRELIDVAGRYDSRVLVEKAVEGCIEINCSVLGGGGREPRVSVCEQPVAWEEFLSFEDKYMRGGKPGHSKGEQSAAAGKSAEGMASLDRRIPAPISEEATKQIQENALAAFLATGASGVARIDSFLNTESGQTWVMEINTTPGSFAFYLWEASGLDFAGLADDMLAIAMARHKTTAERLFTFESGMLEATRGGKSRG
jgi:D-alanine-D-alanine ligase